MSKLTLFLTLILVACTPALADTLFDISFSGPVLSGSGTMTVQPYGFSTTIFTITAINATLTQDSNSYLITGEVLPAFGSFGNDNLLFYPAPHFGFFDSRGVIFALSDGNKLFLDSDNSGNYHEVFDGFQDFAPIIVTPAVPEPDSLILLATGLLGTIGLIRRRIYS